MQEVAARKSVEEQAAEVLSRYTVRDLVEQSDAALDIADKKYADHCLDLSIVRKGEVNMIRFWKVLSKDRLYECRRFENFVWCECKGFQFSRTICKHLALTIAHYCKRCRKGVAREAGLCTGCYLDTQPPAKVAEFLQK